MSTLLKTAFSSLAALTLLLMFGIRDGHSQFALNFQANPGASVWYNCNRGSPTNTCIHGNSADREKTPFLQEMVSDGSANYYHLIIGDPATGFAQETYIRQGSAYFQGGTGSSSAGNIANGGMGGGRGPLDTETGTGTVGTGTGNPTRSQIRQVVGTPGAEFYQEFLKSSFLTKPKVTQNITIPEIATVFIMDMSAINYSTNSIAGTVTNTLRFINPDASGGNFDMTTDKQASNVTGGRYTWSPGFSSGQSNGTYSYADGGAPLNTVDWKAFYNPTQNTCWSYSSGPNAGCTP